MGGCFRRRGAPCGTRSRPTSPSTRSGEPRRPGRGRRPRWSTPRWTASWTPSSWLRSSSTACIPSTAPAPRALLPRLAVRRGRLPAGRARPLSGGAGGAPLRPLPQRSRAAPHFADDPARLPDRGPPRRPRPGARRCAFLASVWPRALPGPCADLVTTAQYNVLVDLALLFVAPARRPPWRPSGAAWRLWRPRRPRRPAMGGTSGSARSWPSAGAGCCGCARSTAPPRGAGWGALVMTYPTGEGPGRLPRPGWAVPGPLPHRARGGGVDQPAGPGGGPSLRPGRPRSAGPPRRPTSCCAGSSSTPGSLGAGAAVVLVRGRLRHDRGGRAAPLPAPGVGQAVAESPGADAEAIQEQAPAGTTLVAISTLMASPTRNGARPSCRARTARPRSRPSARARRGRTRPARPGSSPTSGWATGGRRRRGPRPRRGGDEPHQVAPGGAQEDCRP